MKILFHLFLIFIIFGFKPSAPKIFNSYNNRITLVADDTFAVKANMKGVEIYIFKKNINIFTDSELKDLEKLMQIV